MIDLGALQDELTGLIRQAWPEITAPNVAPQRLWTSVQALRKSFLDDAKSGEIALPCVVIRFGSVDHDPQWGVGSRVYRMPVSVFYIDTQAHGATQVTVHSKVTALAALIEGTEVFATFQSPPERASIDSSEDSPVNAELLGESGIQIVSAMLQYSPGLLAS